METRGPREAGLSAPCRRRIEEACGPGTARRPALAERRTTMMQGREDRRRSARGRRTPSAAPIPPVPALSAAVRRLERRAAKLAGAGRARGEGDRRPRSTALEEADQHLKRRAWSAADLRSRRASNAIEERLFRLCAAASRKYSTPVDGLAALAAPIRRRRPP